MTTDNQFRVTVQQIACWDCPQFWVLLENSKNDSNTVPSVHRKREDAQDQGRRWAKFLGAELIDNTIDVAHRSI